MMMNKVCIFSVLFCIYVLANGESDPSVILWYPIPIRVRQLEALKLNSNISKCHEFILQHIVQPNILQQTTSCNSSSELDLLNPEEYASSTESARLPSTAYSSYTNVRQEDGYPRDIDSGFEDKSTESRIITIPPSTGIRDGTRARSHSIQFTTAPPSYSTEIMRDRISSSEATAPIDNYYNEEDLVYRGMIQVPDDTFSQDGDFSPGYDARSQVGQRVTSNPDTALGGLVHDYLDEVQAAGGKPCNCTTLLTKLLRHYLTEVNTPTGPESELLFGTWNCTNTEWTLTCHTMHPNIGSCNNRLKYDSFVVPHQNIHNNIDCLPENSLLLLTTVKSQANFSKSDIYSLKVKL